MTNSGNNIENNGHSNTTPLPTNVSIGVIGGTGVYGVEGMSDVVEFDNVETPFGCTSSRVVVGKLFGELIAFIARHDTNHRLTPSEVPYCANIYALKMMGVKYLLGFGACGSLREECKPLDVVLPDQFIDRTKAHRQSTFFSGSGIVAHVAFGEPVCDKFRSLLHKTMSSMTLQDVTVHNGGAYVCMEGPAFSTRAESLMYRMLGGTVIGMTALQEAKLAREAEIAYGLVAFVTDFDSWHEDHDNVTVDMVVKTLKQNSVNAQVIVKEVVQALSKDKFASAAHDALKYAVLTRENEIPQETKHKLKHLVGKYMNCD